MDSHTQKKKTKASLVLLRKGLLAIGVGGLHVVWAALFGRGRPLPPPVRFSRRLPLAG